MVMAGDRNGESLWRNLILNNRSRAFADEEKIQRIWETLENYEAIKQRFRKNLKRGASSSWSDVVGVTKKVLEDFETLLKAGCVDRELLDFLKESEIGWYFCTNFFRAITKDINAPIAWIMEKNRLKIDAKDLDRDLFFDALKNASKDWRDIVDNSILSIFENFYKSWEIWFIDNFLKYFSQERLENLDIIWKVSEKINVEEMKEYIIPRECLQNMLKRKERNPRFHISKFGSIKRFEDYKRVMKSFDFSEYRDLATDEMVKWLLDEEEWELLSEIVCNFPQKKRMEILKILMQYWYGEDIISNINTYRWINRQDVVKMLCRYWYKEDVKNSNIKWAFIK